MSKRKSKSLSSDGLDISKVLAEPVRIVQDGNSKKMAPYEAQLRQHLRKALVEKSIQSIKYLFGQATKHGVLKRPKTGRTCGVLIIPKWFPKDVQDEIFEYNPDKNERDWWQRAMKKLARHDNDKSK